MTRKEQNPWTAPRSQDHGKHTGHGGREAARRGRGVGAHCCGRGSGVPCFPIARPPHTRLCCLLRLRARGVKTTAVIWSGGSGRVIFDVWVYKRNAEDSHQPPSSYCFYCLFTQIRDKCSICWMQILQYGTFWSAWIHLRTDTHATHSRNALRAWQSLLAWMFSSLQKVSFKTQRAVTSAAFLP